MEESTCVNCGILREEVSLLRQQVNHQSIMEASENEEDLLKMIETLKREYSALKSYVKDLQQQGKTSKFSKLIQSLLSYLKKHEESGLDSYRVNKLCSKLRSLVKDHIPGGPGRELPDGGGNA